MSSSRTKANPYVLDEMFVSVHHSAAGIIWRWRSEFAAVLAVTCSLAELSNYMRLWQAATLLGALVLVVLAVPHTRRLAWARVQCLITRHRLHRLFWNKPGLHTRTGRIPLIVWIRPTKVGVRAHVICRAGICAKDFEDNTGELAAACFAREARVTRNPARSQLVTIDIIRRDTLAAKHTVPSPLPGVPARHQAATPTWRRQNMRRPADIIPAPRAEVIPFPNRRTAGNPVNPA